MKIKIIDLFAGPGGLGEGFASYRGGSIFSIAASAEMEASAHSTLKLRAFYRLARGDRKALDAYYSYCNQEGAPHPSVVHEGAWKAACDEALQLQLGNLEDNQFLDVALGRKKLSPDSTVLIGGPPCQAYSLVGRARNRGKKDYVPEKDARHYLYQQYLRIVHKYEPAVFVMENVKGILTSQVGGKRVFHEILRDLSDPGRAIGQGGGARYRIHSLVEPVHFEPGQEPEDFDSAKFVIRAERYGVPQARHRVILLGVRADIPITDAVLMEPSPALNIEDVIGDLPRVRSRLSKGDTAHAWRDAVLMEASGLIGAARGLADEALEPVLKQMQLSRDHLLATESFGALRYSPRLAPVPAVPSSFWNWMHDPRLEVVMNHEARGHMQSDLRRYFYAAAYAKAMGVSPKGHQQFQLPGLAPSHANWESGKFQDRFRVQVQGRPGTTITSHIAKDGHYFIHYDAEQCRSLTVREAARLQTFPDNYFFMGNRTQQYHQVGNAVPSFLAHQIAGVVHRILPN